MGLDGATAITARVRQHFGNEETLEGTAERDNRLLVVRKMTVHPFLCFFHFMFDCDRHLGQHKECYN